MERTDYPGLLQKVQPGQAVDILNDRVAQVKRLNTSIADWLAERCRLEEQYAAGLRRLARKPIDDMDLGIFSVPWNALTDSMSSLADSHQGLGSKIEVDVERPLREFANTNREMQAMTTMQGNLMSMAKEVEKAQDKTLKLQGKGEKADANKVANASSDYDQAKVQWDSQAPYVFETLQALDETRVNTLRDHLTQYVTLEVDQMEKNRVAAESSLNVLLNVETADEIKTFALKAASARRGSVSRQQRMSFMPGIPTPSRGASSSGPSGPSSGLTPIQSIPDEASQASAGTPEPQKKGGLKGLRRLGTVMSKRSSKMPAQLPTTSESPERKPRSSPFGALRRNKNSYTEALEPPQESSSSQRPHSPLRMGSEVLEPPVSRQATSSSSQGPPRLDPIPRTNGIGSATSPTAPSFTPSFANGSHQGDLAGLEPPKPAQPVAPTFAPVAEPSRDSEGFSVPPQNLDPISQAQADAEMAGEAQQPQFNVNIRNAPIQEEGGEAALANMAGKLQAPPPNARRAGTVRGRRDARNSAIVSTYGPPGDSAPEQLSVVTPQTVERSVEPAPVAAAPLAVQPPPQASTSNLVQSPSGAFSPAGPSSTAFSPFSPIAATSPLQTGMAPLTSDHTGDNQSIRSGRSLQSTASHGMKHPELQEQGLNSSIIETVSARFEHGQIVSSSLVGEIALAYNPVNFSTSLGQETIRIENFASLDKVAPNPAFIAQSSGREGEYAVNLATITRTQIAFKYQLRAEDATTHTPLLLTPAFRIEPNQASVIVSYSLHPSFSLQAESITFSNVTIAFTLEGTKAASCQSRPVGTFAREKNLIFWQLGDITVRPGGAPEKLLARFATESEASGGHVEARWEVTGDGANGLGSGLAVSVHAADGADPFADEATQASSWKAVPTVRKLASGSYVAKS
ncbi:Cytoskeletal protein syp1 [Pseudocercospora fuligena]|uniref:Cytoskeletal protein syp1 n=1 Tax=Pseudocercospora fuligena TaxID=685502 RepID=A0A8H6VJ77_9PEZI|nr:Cytoskeletal protein syp1 [Pseudocercospora fuligena]